MRNRLTASAAGRGLIASLTAMGSAMLLIIAGMFVFAAPASAAPTGNLSYDGTDLRYHFVNDQGIFVQMTVAVDGVVVTRLSVQPNTTVDNRVDPSELELVCGDDYTAVLAVDVVQGPLDTLVFTACEKPAGTESPSPDTKAIEAKALTDHSCDSTEWHFVINQVASEAQAPAEIVVTWANGKTEKVVLEKFTGGTAHYTTTSNLNSTVTKATAAIYASWSGQFNLSHGPCKSSSPSPTESTPTEVTAAAPTSVDKCGTANDTYTIPSKEGVVYEVDGKEVAAGTYPGTGTVTVTASAEEGFVLKGDSEWTFVFTNVACDTNTPTPTPTKTTSTPTPTETTPTSTPTETTPAPTDTPSYGGDAGAASPVSSGSRLPLIAVAMLFGLMVGGLVWSKMVPAHVRRH